MLWGINQFNNIKMLYRKYKKNNFKNSFKWQKLIWHNNIIKYIVKRTI